MSEDLTEKIRHTPIDFVLILRGLLACSVVVFHANAAMGPEISRHIWWGFKPAGEIAVWSFFVLSGYLMGKGFYTGRYQLTWDSLQKFFTNRFFRIVPLYLLVMVATFLVFAVLMPQVGIQSHWLKLVVDLLTFQYTSFDNLGAFNGLMWTISTEVQFYFWVPVWFKGLSMALKYVSAPWLLVGLLLAGTLLRMALFQQELYPLFKLGDYGVMFQTWAKLLYVPLSTNAYLFAGGMLLNWLIPSGANILKSSKWLAGGLMILPIVAYLLVSYLLPLSFSNFHFWAFKLYVQFVPLLAFLVVTPYLLWNELKFTLPQALQGTLSPAVGVFETLGKWSYGIYLWHGLFLWHVTGEWVKLKHFGGNIHLYWCGVVVVFLLIACGLSALTYRFIEQPFEKRKQKAMPLEQKNTVHPFVVDTMRKSSQSST